MAAARLPGTVTAVDARRPDRTVLADASLFLVEFSGGSPEGSSVDGMHAALRLAVIRVAAAGMTIQWYGGWFVPTEQRCLCLIEAADEACVVSPATPRR
jgi:hypothetical protein